MLFKLAISNVKKSIRDYAVYFLTLAFGVCIFYVFNSIESQQAMLEINASQKDILKSLSEIIGYISVFISVILGFLIVYANKFLIRRRKRELGIYMTLGMPKGKISRMLITETLIIGLFSLVVGIVSGIFISQGLSVITAKMFAVNMKAYAFVFSNESFIKSIFYFGLIFVIVMIFNTISISRYKLITLLNANRRNESLKIKKLWVSVLLFIVSVICLGVAYYLIIKNGMVNINLMFGMSILLGSIGTLLFFMSLSGFLLKVIKSNKKLYYKNLNMFVLRQLNSKINTTFVSMSIICLMLLITIGSLSTGASIANALTQDLKSLTPYDCSVSEYDNDENGVESIADKFKKSGINVSDFAKNYCEMKYYMIDLKYDQLIINGTENIVDKSTFEYMDKVTIPVVSLSDYNKLLLSQGFEPISLKENEFAVNNNHQDMQEFLNHFLNNKGTVKIQGKELIAKYKQPLQMTLITSAMNDGEGAVVVNDSILKDSKASKLVLNIKYKDGSNDKEIKDKLMVIKEYNEKINTGYFDIITREEVFEQNTGMKAVITYLALYIGIVFLITSAAILALQQLSEASDNYERYNLLRKLGAEEKMIKKSLFSQILVYFMMPLGLAIIHSVVGIKVANDVVKMFGKLDILSSTITTAITIIIIYGGYFLATYLSSKNIIRQKKS